ncbi:MAG: aldo/keto reductase [Oscillospiraceae bacterium]|nr:aldo/keto reductase [Oscillospiraceae bacterium]
MNLSSTLKLNNGVEIPVLGLGTYQIGDESATYEAVRYALDAGYRHIDTAAAYYNETGIGKAIKDSKINREDIFITTKLWNEDQRQGNQYKAFEQSLERLGVDYIDLYLIHWPVKEKIAESWKILEKIYKENRARAVGVCNFLIHHLEEIFAASDLIPAVNQVECHPWLTQVELADYCQKKGMIFEPWSPFGVGALLGDETLISIAKKYNKSAAQLILKWGLQRGFINIPKSANKDRIQQNTEIFDFAITGEDMSEIFKLNIGKRVGAHPDTFTF